MKPVRLHLQGFTAFHNPVTVDFADRKLFAITGPTGAGKSSLLDAMIWALFGKVPRVGIQVGSLISHGSNRAVVTLEFEARGLRYRVARSRPTKGATTARLERMHANGDAEPLADSVNEVNAQVEALLGINYDTFVKTIILPQGEFSAFLSGDPKDKKDVLTKLLGLDVYKSMMQSANTRASGARAAADLLQQQHDQIEYQTSESIAPLGAHVRATEEQQQRVIAYQANLKRLESAADEYSARAREARAAALAANEAQARAHQAALAAEEARTALEAAEVSRETLAGEIAALDYDADAHELTKQQIGAAEQVEAARTHLEAAERATAEARAAEGRATADAEQYRRAAADGQAALEHARAKLAAIAAPATTAAASLDAGASAAQHDSAAAAQKSHEFELRARQLQHLAGAAIALRRELEAADSEVQRAIVAAAAAEATQVHAEARTRAAANDLEAAQQHLDVARTQEAAAAIVATLKVGDPCPVCGEPITELNPHATPDLDAAHAVLTSAREAHAKAQSAHQLASNKAAAAHAHLEAVRTSYAAIEAKGTTLDAELAAASVTRANVDRSAKRASTAAAAEHERAIEAQQRAEASKQAAHGLRALLAKLPHDLVVEPGDDPAVEADAVEALAARLDAAIEEHAYASACATSAATAAQQAESHIAAAAAEVKTAVALQQQQASAVETATQTLVALGGPAATSLPGLRAELEAFDALAARAGTLAAKLARAEQQHAAATAVIAERNAACETAARAVLEAKDVSAAATAAAEESCAAFEAEWRRQLPPDNEPDATAVPELIEATAQHAARLAAAVGHAKATLEAAQKEVTHAQQLREELEAYQGRAAVAKELGLELQANNFVAFIQREAMQVLATDAGERMLQLSRDRYRLEADGDEFVVVDRLNGDERRSVRTLSGGETFLASLALALALSERLPELSGRGGALSLESLFLDEGFGSLDVESLDIAIQGLELLASGSRMIGVISHVPELAERLPDRVEVVKSGGTSTVRDGRN